MSIYSYRSTYVNSIVTTNPKPTADRASLVSQLVRNLPAVQETLDSIPGLGRSPGEGNGKPLQNSCLENPLDREAWWLLPSHVTLTSVQMGAIIVLTAQTFSEG